MAHRVTFLDVFAERPLAGNGLAVLHGADDLDEETMLAFARETRLSETTFVQVASEPGAEYRNRIWTPIGEIPFAGHPSLGTAVAVARERGESAAAYVQQCGAGLQPIEVELEGDRASASMVQNEPDFGPEVERSAAMACVGLQQADAHPELAPQVVSTGLAHLLAPVAEAESLARCAPDYAAIRELLEPLGAHNHYLTWLEPGGSRARARGFMGGEAGEDPATGSAAGPLCAYLAERLGVRALEIEQGVEMGRPSRLLAERVKTGVRVSGTVIAIADGETTF